MKYFLVAMGVGAAALAGVSSANAADRPSAKQNAQTEQSTDISARQRHHRSYGYYPRHHGYYGGGPYGYYGGGPGVTFSFGGGRW